MNIERRIESIEEMINRGDRTPQVVRLVLDGGEVCSCECDGVHYNSLDEVPHPPAGSGRFIIQRRIVGPPEVLAQSR